MKLDIHLVPRQFEFSPQKDELVFDPYEMGDGDYPVENELIVAVWFEGDSVKQVLALAKRRPGGASKEDFFPHWGILRMT
jgi:hypothetical protein